MINTAILAAFSATNLIEHCSKDAQYLKSGQKVNVWEPDVLDISFLPRILYIKCSSACRMLANWVRRLVTHSFRIASDLQSLLAVAHKICGRHNNISRANRKRVVWALHWEENCCHKCVDIMVQPAEHLRSLKHGVLGAARATH